MGTGSLGVVPVFWFHQLILDNVDVHLLVPAFGLTLPPYQPWRRDGLATTQLGWRRMRLAGSRTVVALSRFLNIFRREVNPLTDDARALVAAQLTQSYFASHPQTSASAKKDTPASFIGSAWSSEEKVWAVYKYFNQRLANQTPLTE